MTALQEIITNAKEELSDRISTEKYPEDLVHEIADIYVPVDINELMKLATDPLIVHHENKLTSEEIFNQAHQLILQALFEHL